ncbi:tRNA (guanosine(46)-N7)-methyltransferase TrmB [Tsukamurella soli]|uniref:tRNA (guanine-N(7)-)-methyltransferase n=1 Tax=Tsukamurella soli TaxID=644556 RepID=A0ABP8KHC9_9ACTN
MVTVSNTFEQPRRDDSRDPRAQHRRLYPRVTSFRSRRGALTPAQQRWWDEMWPRIGRDIAPAQPFDPADTVSAADPLGPAAPFPTPAEPLDAAQWFGRTAPLVVEIGSGTGTSTVAMAAAEPDVDVIAVEVYVPGIAQTLGGVQRAGLDNVRVVRGDGVAVLEDMIAPGSLTGVRVYFPDPWPKARHHKRRLLQPRMFALLASRLRPGGIVHVATDHADYAEWIGAVGDGEPALRRLLLPEDLADADVPVSVDRPVTKFQGKAEQVGREIHEFVWERRQG